MSQGGEREGSEESYPKTVGRGVGDHRAGTGRRPQGWDGSEREGRMGGSLVTPREGDPLPVPPWGS